MWIMTVVIPLFPMVKPPLYLPTHSPFPLSHALVVVDAYFNVFKLTGLDGR